MVQLYNEITRAPCLIPFRSTRRGPEPDDGVGGCLYRNESYTTGLPACGYGEPIWLREEERRTAAFLEIAAIARFHTAILLVG